MHAYPVKVHLSDTDVTGQVYYAKPLEWLEWCRVDWFTRHYGNFLNYVETNGLTFFPARAVVDYKKPIFFNDELVVELRVKEIKKISFIFAYTLKRVHETVLKSEITMVCFDVRKKSLAALPGHLLEDLKSLEPAAV
ncbi:MAG: acyl-CoA thioesterase [Candidatus Firestonebacteria bacterium]|nr:acyl-CoA thioesterase [Candidatus Firestonebacteria bacterium]